MLYVVIATVKLHKYNIIFPLVQLNSNHPYYFRASYVEIK